MGGAMPRAGAAALILVLAVLGTSAAYDAAPAPRPASAATARAVLKPIAGTPFRVRGSRFLPSERVRVTVTPTGRAGIVRRVRASRRGVFVLAFRGLQACQGVHGTARGSRGSRAAFQFSSVRC
jgi:hypothetical protein